MPKANRRARSADFAALVADRRLEDSPVISYDEAAARSAVVDVAKYKQDDRRVVFTVDHAIEYVELPVFPGERPVGDRHSQHLLDEMTRGNFNWDLVILARCLFNGSYYKINGQHTCFPAGTLVRLADGSQRPIEQVRPTDEVLSAEGRVRRVMQCHRRHHDGALTTVKLWGHSHLRCTPNHKLLTRRGYVAAEALTTDDWIRIPRYAPRSATILLTEAHVGAIRESNRVKNAVGPTASFATRGPNCNDVPDIIGLDADFGRLLGLYLAEGCAFKASRNSRILWTFAAHEEATLGAETIALLDRVLGLTAVSKIHKNRVDVTTYGIVVRDLFLSLCGLHAAGKRLHVDLLAGPEEFLAAVFWGWMDGDGCSRGRGGRYRCGATVSRQLAIQMFDIANFLGLAPQFSIEPRAGARWNPVWKVQVAVKPAGARHPGLPEVEDGCTWRRIRAVASSPFEGDVFNIGVEEDNSYVAEGLGVSNCWARMAAKLPSDPVVREITYKVDSVEAMRHLYSTYDRSKIRSDAHLTRVRLLGFDLPDEVNIAVAIRVVPGLRLWKFERQEDYRRCDDDKIAAILADPATMAAFCAVARFAQGLGKDARPVVNRQPAYAAMLATFAVDEDAAVAFWTDVAEGTNLTKDDARYHLHNYLKKSVLALRSSTDKKKVGAEDMYRLCVSLWNKWRGGEAVVNARVPLARPKAK